MPFMISIYLLPDFSFFSSIFFLKRPRKNASIFVGHRKYFQQPSQVLSTANEDTCVFLSILVTFLRLMLFVILTSFSLSFLPSEKLLFLLICFFVNLVIYNKVGELTLC